MNYVIQSSAPVSQSNAYHAAFRENLDGCIHNFNVMLCLKLKQCENIRWIQRDTNSKHDEGEMKEYQIIVVIFTPTLASM